MNSRGVNLSGLEGGGSIAFSRRSDSGVGCKLETLSNDDESVDYE